MEVETGGAAGSPPVHIKPASMEWEETGHTKMGPGAAVCTSCSHRAGEQGGQGMQSTSVHSGE